MEKKVDQIEIKDKLTEQDMTGSSVLTVMTMLNDNKSNHLNEDKRKQVILVGHNSEGYVLVSDVIRNSELTKPILWYTKVVSSQSYRNT